MPSSKTPKNVNKTTSKPKKSKTASAKPESKTAMGLKAGKADKSNIKVSSVWKKLRFFIAFCIWGSVFVAALLIWFAWDLPNPEKANQAITRAPTLTLLSSEGHILRRQGAVHGRAITLDEVPPSVVQAFVATEDRRFYDHFGIDLIGFGRAVFVNLTSGGYRQGGSSLTQQLAKNLFLTREKTIRRKVQELLLALWLEKTFSKDEILTIYLNRVYLGAGVYGIDAASRRYFGKPASNLTLYQSAVLAGLPKAPTAYNPRANAKRSAKRANLVLDLMVRAEFLQKDQAEKLKRKKVETVGDSRGQNRRYFADWIIGRVSHLIGPMDEDLVIQTSFNMRHQSILEKQAAKIMKQASKQKADQVAAVIMDENGAVSAMLGGQSWAKSPFNRAVHAKRQTGSVFKTIAYLAGLEAGLEPDSMIDISDVVIEGWSPRDGTDIIPEGGIKVQAVSMIEGLTRSLNKAAVAIAESAGRGQVIQMARRLGITAPLGEHASLSLGVQEVSLMEMTGAYAVLAHEGKSAIPHGIKEIRTGSGELLFKHYPDMGDIISPKIAQDMNKMLRSVVENGTGKRVVSVQGAAGKTGTTQLNKDAWFIGFAENGGQKNARLTMGIWMGNDKATPMKQVSGGGYPAILWQRVMSEIN